MFSFDNGGEVMRDSGSGFVKRLFIFMCLFFVKVYACSVLFGYVYRFINVDVCGEEAMVKPM